MFQNAVYEDNRRQAGIQRCYRRTGEDSEKRGHIRSVEGLHSVLHPPGAPHSPNLHLPRADGRHVQTDGITSTLI